MKRTATIITAGIAGLTAFIAVACAAHSTGSQKPQANVWSETTLAKLDAPARLLADTLRSGERSGRTTVGVLVTMADGASAQSIADAGFKVASDMGKVALVSLPADSLGRLASLPQVKSVSLGTTQTISDPQPAVQKFDVPAAKSSPVAYPVKSE